MPGMVIFPIIVDTILRKVLSIYSIWHEVVFFQ
jgi:hypothetical protein